MANGHGDHHHAHHDGHDGAAGHTGSSAPDHEHRTESPLEPGYPQHPELATLVTVMLLGHWLEMKSIFQAQGALQELAKLLPSTAVRLVGDRTEEVEVGVLGTGDLVLVRPGASVPADGEVVEGRSSVNEAMITGESRPVEKTAGEQVIAGTTNGSGSLRVRVTGTGERTALAGIMRLVAQAQSSRSRAQALADRAAFYLTLVAIGAGALTLIVWLLLRAEPAYAIERTVTVLVIACPHALGLAIPLVVAISTTLGARSGLLVRDRRGLEEARNLNTVVFDKTGTLTLGEHRVVETTAVAGLTEHEALRLAAAVERDSEHPVAQAIVTSAGERGAAVPATISRVKRTDQARSGRQTHWSRTTMARTSIPRPQPVAVTSPRSARASHEDDVPSASRVALRSHAAVMPTELRGRRRPTRCVPRGGAVGSKSRQRGDPSGHDVPPRAPQHQTLSWFSKKRTSFS